MTPEFHTALSVQIEVLRAERKAITQYELVYPNHTDSARGTPLFERKLILEKQIAILEARLKNP